MITIKHIGLLICCLVVCDLGRSQNVSVRWSSFSQGLMPTSSATTSVLSTVGVSTIGTSSDASIVASSGFLAGVSLFSLVTDAAQETSLPQSFELYQNYPNPFNPTTTISYDLPAFSRVTIQVFNLIGQQIATLADQEQPPGRYKLVWNGGTDSGMPAASGVYFYRIVAKEHSGGGRQFTSTRKFLLLK